MLFVHKIAILHYEFAIVYLFCIFLMWCIHAPAMTFIGWVADTIATMNIYCSFALHYIRIYHFVSRTFFIAFLKLPHIFSLYVFGFVFLYFIYFCFHREICHFEFIKYIHPSIHTNINRVCNIIVMSSGFFCCCFHFL